MRRILSFPCLLALVAACWSGNGEEAPREGVLVPVLHGPVSEMVGLGSLLRPGTSASNVATRAFQLDMNQAGGIRYLRNEFMWHNIEPSRGNFDFSGHDTIVAEADARGIEFIGLLCYGAPWAAAGSGGNKMYPPDDPEDFARFAAMTVTRYKDKIHLWEIWNEQNIERFWKPEPDPEGYGTMFKAAADAIHGADPNAKVAFGGMAPVYSGAWENMYGFLEEVYAFHPDIGDYFDILAIHTYTWVQVSAPEIDDPVNPLQQSVPRMINDAREIMLRWEGRSKPIWITEIGWYTSPNDPLGYVTREDQARYLARSFILSVANGVEIFCWYTFRDNWDHMNDSEDAFGLVEYDPDPTDADKPKPKPAYKAYKALAEVLGDTYYSHDMRAGLGLSITKYAYRFVTPDGSKTVTALWTTDDISYQVAIPVDPGATSFTQVDMLGNESMLYPAKGLLLCFIKQSPIYVVEERF